MSTFQVETEALVGAATGVKSSVADLDAARQAVAATAGAAAGTPAASAYETLLGDANQQLESLQSAVTELSQALNQASSNYSTSDQASASGFGGPMRARWTMSAFGFEIPQGDPAALTAASTSWRRLGLALINEGDAVAGGARMTLGSAGWQGPASQAFADNSERLIKAFTADADASGRAATALSKLSDALAHAQQVARQALSDCGNAQDAVNSHQQAAGDAGRAAQAADEQAASAVHPTTRSTFQQQADQARQQQTAANNAATLASNQLMAAQARGQQAVTAYEHEAQAIAATLNAAAGELEGAEEVGEGWAKPVITWLGHANDFGGAGAVGLIKGYDAAIGVAVGKLDGEISGVLGDDEAMASIMGGQTPAASKASETRCGI